MEHIGMNIFAVLIQEWSRVLAFSFRNTDFFESTIERIELNLMNSN